MGKLCVKLFCVGLLLSASTGWSAAAAATAPGPEDLDKQAAFKKLYASREKDDHLKALKALEGSKHASTTDILITVIRVDPFPDVRVAAFRMLSLMPARDETLARILVDFFQSFRLNEVEAHCDYAKYMVNSEFKFLISQALVEYGSHLSYPDLINTRPNARVPTNAGDPNVQIRKRREDFEAYSKVFNEVTGANIVPKKDSSPLLFKKWWTENQDRFIRQDRELVEKFRKEDLDAANKLHPFGTMKTPADPKK